MLGHLIYNYQHLDDCRIQQEISKNLYKKAFEDVFLVHAYNGKAEFGYKKYLEDQLISIKNRGHFKGAIDLINAGLNYFIKNKKAGLKYVLVTAADTWMLNVEFLKKIVGDMEKENKILATSSWSETVYPQPLKGFATDFFIIDIEWNRQAKLFPVDYDGFCKKFNDFFYLMYNQPIVDVAVQYNFQKYFGEHYTDNDIWRMREKKLCRIAEREPVHRDGHRIANWPEIGLYTSPDNPVEKQQALRALRCNFGPHSKQLINAKDLTYYNRLK